MTIRDIAIAFGYKIDKKSEKQANDSINKLKSVATKALGAIAVVFSIKGLASLAEAAANAGALESQFSSVFGNMEDRAEKTLNNIAGDVGALPNRLKGSFTQIAAFAKTSGMDTENALNLSDRAMRAVADSAAFYDKSLEQVTESLQSFLKGNYANDAALGLSATETTRNAAANALYGKSFKDLAEDQKQLTLLKMAEDANTLSGALGQAARESDTWGNQVGNLKQGVKDLQASVGSAFLKPAIQVVKLLALLVGYATDAVKSLTAEGKPLNRMFERFTNCLKKAQVYIERFVKRVGGAQNAFQLLAVAAASILTAMNAEAIISFLKKLPGLFNPANLKILGIAAVIALLFLAIDDFINFMRGNGSAIGAIFEKWGIDADAVRQSMIQTWEKVKTFLLTVWQTIKNTAAKVFFAVRDYVVGLFERLKENGAINNFKAAFEKAGTAIGEIFKAVTAIVDALFETTSKVANGTQPFIAWLVGEALPGVIGFLADIVSGAADLISWLGKIGALKPLIMGLVTAFMAYKTAVLASSIAHKALDFGKLVSGGTKTAKAFITLTAAKMKDKIETLQIAGLYAKDYITAIGKTIASMAKATAAWVANTAKMVASKGAMLASKAAMLAMSVAQKAVTAAQWLLNAAMSANPIGLIIAAVVALIAIFVALWNNNEAFRNFFIKAWGAVKDFFIGLWEGIAGFFTGIWDGITGTAKGAADAIMGFLQPVFDLVNSVKNAIGGAVDGAKNFVGGAVDKLKGVLGFATGTKSTPDTFMAGEQGPELVTGAKGRKVFTASKTEGIIGAIGAAVKTAKTVVSELRNPMSRPQGSGGENNNITVNVSQPDSGAIAAVKGIGGIIGNAMKGIADKVAAFKDNADSSGITGALRSFGSDIANLAKGATASPATVQEMVTSTTNRSVTQNNYFESTFHGDRAGQKRSSDAMNKSANDATDELARALAYAR